MLVNTRPRVGVIAAVMLIAAGLATAARAAASAGGDTGSYRLKLAHIFHVKVPADAIKRGWCYDVGLVNPATHAYYLADAANRAVTSIDPTSGDTGSIGTGLFSGINKCHQQNQFNGQGPDGLAISGSTIFAGNGDSHVLGFSLSGGPKTFDVNTGGKLQADQLAVAGKYLVVSNGAETPHPFVSFLDATGRQQKVLGRYTLPDATGALGQIQWWHGHLYVAVSASTSSPKGGEVEELDIGNIHNVRVVRRFTFKNCQPAGLAINAGGLAAIGCGPPAPQVILNVTTGRQTSVRGGVVGVNLTATDRGDFFFVSFITNQLSVVDAAGKTLQQFGIVSSHTVTVDPTNGDVWVPEVKGEVALYKPAG